MSRKKFLAFPLLPSAQIFQPAEAIEFASISRSQTSAIAAENEDFEGWSAESELS